MIAVERNHNRTVAAATSLGGEAVRVACDLSSREDVERLVARIEGEWAERPDTVVCDAGSVTHVVTASAPS